MKATSYLKLSIVAAIATIVLKMLAWWATDSIGYLSDAMESFVNLAGATFALTMVALARTPADADHPYGHGKAEYFSAGFEGILIFGAAVAILVSSVDRIFYPVPLENLGAGTLLSMVSTLINFVVARLLLAASVTHRSLALEADSRHLMTDVWTTVGVITGVGLAMLTRNWWIDPLVAIAVALNILREGFHLVRSAVDGLMDKALGADETAQLNGVFAAFKDQGCQFANLRTRSAGQQHFAHVDLRLPGTMSVAEAHRIADAVEDKAFADTTIVLTTHIEPLP